MVVVVVFAIITVKDVQWITRVRKNNTFKIFINTDKIIHNYNILRPMQNIWYYVSQIVCELLVILFMLHFYVCGLYVDKWSLRKSFKIEVYTILLLSSSQRYCSNFRELCSISLRTLSVNSIAVGLHQIRIVRIAGYSQQCCHKTLSSSS